ncbi:DUF4402 domain-containing protein [Sediminicola sp. 1XM1-17]|uniref:DUF4402 domain-containing protein n=1 Tax=Sediminicola sp. 1XM1-17 TaxID=3127702 RepID=UPI003076AF51
MNKHSRILSFALFLAATAASAQDSATASTTAEIITPISIVNAADMNFGTLAAAPTTGTVVLGTDGSRSSTGGVTLSTSGTASTAASFTVTGEANSTYSLTLPSSITLSGPTSTMTVDTFISSPATQGTLNGSGSSTVNIGATLNVGANQADEVYTNAADLTVTVNYN